jgi:hypothetical protein
MGTSSVTSVSTLTTWANPVEAEPIICICAFIVNLVDVEAPHYLPLVGSKMILID